MKYKNQILDLRNQGKTYNEISSILGISKGLISYHCGDGQKEKNKKRLLKFKSKSSPLLYKFYRFIKEKPNIQKSIISSDRKRFLNKYHNFIRNSMTDNFTIDDVIKKFGENPKCYLTGVEIDISKPKTYQFDHIIPISRGGDNSLDNLGLCSNRANISKNDMTPQEFIDFCKKVLEHNNYIVSKGIEA